MAILFNGTTEYATVASMSRINNARVWSASCWIFMPTLPDGFLFSKTGVAGVAPFVFEMAVLTGGGIAVNIDNAGTPTQSTNTSQQFNINTPVHFAVVFNGGGSTDAERVRAFIDGAEVTLTYSATTPAALSTATNDMHLAVRAGGTLFLAGYMQELRMWEFPLTPQGVKNDMISSVPAHPEYLRFWAPFTISTDTKNYVPWDGAITINTASPDGGDIRAAAQIVNQAPSSINHHPSRRWRTRRAFTQKNVPFYPLMHRGM